jgi:hypothetical protein
MCIGQPPANICLKIGAYNDPITAIGLTMQLFRLIFGANLRHKSSLQARRTIAAKFSGIRQREVAVPE